MFSAAHLFGYFLFMIVFMVIAIITAKRKIYNIWFILFLNNFLYFKNTAIFYIIIRIEKHNILSS